MNFNLLFALTVSCICVFHVHAQTIKKNEVTIGVGFGHNIFNSPNDYKFKKGLIQNDYYLLMENNFEISKKIKQTEHHINLKTTWHTFTKNNALNKSNIKLQHTLKHQLSKKLRLSF